MRFNGLEVFYPSSMTQPEDLTGQILHLRKKGVLRAEALENEIAAPPPPVARRMPADLFAITLYGLLALALLGQVGLVIILALP